MALRQDLIPRLFVAFVAGAFRAEIPTAGACQIPSIATSNVYSDYRFIAPMVPTRYMIMP